MASETTMAGDAEAAGAAAGMAEVYGDGVTAGTRLWRVWCGWEWSPPASKVAGFSTAIHEYEVVARIDERQVICRQPGTSSYGAGNCCVLHLDDKNLVRSESAAWSALGQELARRTATLRAQWEEVVARVGTTVLDASAANATVTESKP